MPPALPPKPAYSPSAYDAEALQKAPVAVHHRSACSGVKALRNTSGVRRRAAKLCYRFGPLTPSAGSANLIAGDGTKNGFPARNKEPATNQKRLLDRKSPIQGSNLASSSRESGANRASGKEGLYWLGQMIAQAARCHRGAGSDDRRIAKEQLAEARGRGHGFSLQLSASACRREW
jgi:hypothetical protein